MPEESRCPSVVRWEAHSPALPLGLKSKCSTSSRAPVVTDGLFPIEPTDPGAWTASIDALAAGYDAAWPGGAEEQFRPVSTASPIARRGGCRRTLPAGS